MVEGLNELIPVTTEAKNVTDEASATIEDITKNKEADAEATRAQEEAERAQTQATEEAEKARKSYNETIVNGFKAIEQEAAQSPKELAKALLENEAVMNNWATNIGYLSNKGMSALAESFETVGVEAMGKFLNELAYNMDQAEQKTGMSIDELIALHGKLPPAVAETLNDTQLETLDFLAAQNATLINKGEENMDAYTGTIEDGADEAENSGEKLGGASATGVENGIPKVTTAAKKLTENASSAMSSEIPKFINVGVNISAGVATGIRQGNGLVSGAARSIIKNAINAMEKEGRIESPSKEAAIIGKFLGEGLDVGLHSTLPMIEKSAREYINKALSSMQNSATVKLQLEIDTLTKSIKEHEEHNKKMARMRDIASKEEAVATAKNSDERIKAEETLNETLEKYRIEDLKDQLSIKEEELKLIEEAEKEKIQLEKERFDAFKNSIDERKYYNQLSIADEIALWEEAQRQYAHNSEERNKSTRKYIS